MADMTIDYIPITQWGFTLNDVQGDQDGPALKHPYVFNWNDRHGVDIDLDTAFLEPLDMQLTFVIIASTFAQYRSRLNSFKAQMRKPGLHVIKFPNAGDPPYFCFQSDVIRVEPITGRGSTRIASKVYVNLTVPYPVGRFFQITSTGVSFRISCNSPMLIDWGDGTSRFVEGTNVLVSRNFSTFSYVGILGNIEDITNLSSIVGMTEIVEV
ncbi:MAG TPA: hypothetical protein VK145_02775 [Candidatus Nanoarchaeia archaeon]|nr:hypothetical protein [Candidatus Nanoarchaeia archaeon]